MYYSNSFYYSVPMTPEQYETYKQQSAISLESRGTQPGADPFAIREERLFDPLKGLVYGNLFSAEYRGYKEYQPGIVKPKNERESMLENLMQYGFAAHDLGLKLDVYPGDKELLKKFEEYDKKAEEARKSYEEKYGPLTPSSAKEVDGQYSWTLVPSAWLR